MLQMRKRLSLCHICFQFHTLGTDEEGVVTFKRKKSEENPVTVRVISQEKHDRLSFFKSGIETKKTIETFVKEGEGYIVSLMVADYIFKNHTKYSTQFYCPDTSGGAVRDSNGTIAGTLNLVQFR